MASNATDLELIVLSALWHDVGKIRQKAGEPLSREYDGLKTYCCPTIKGNSTHFHVLHGGQFIGQYFRKLGDFGREIERLVLYHHRHENFPDQNKKRLCKILTLSDWLSSGERTEQEEAPGKFTSPLISIFSRLKLSEEDSTSKNTNDSSQEPGIEFGEEYFPLKPLGKEPFFPTSESNQALPLNAYHILFHELEEDIQRLSMEPIEDFITKSFYLLMKHAFFVPSAAYKSKPDVSLFGHSHSTAAIAACLFKDGITEEELDKAFNVILNQSDSRDSILASPRFILIGGDISGIQDFIYSITSEGALKSLRGRSYYLQILTETLAKSILRELGLPLPNLLTCGGGHFYILAPVKGTVEKLKEIKKCFNSVLIHSHRGKLTAVLGHCSLSLADFLKLETEKGTSPQGLIESWGKVGLSLGREKRQKFSEFLSQEKDFILGPFDEGGTNKVCSLCGEEIQGSSEEKCELCLSFESLSRELSKDFIIEKQAPNSFSGRPKNWQEILEALGWEIRFSDSPRKNSYRINSTEFTSFDGNGFKFIGRHVPFEDGSIITLDSLAEKSEGIERWGILRADVDNLGKIIGQGLKEDKTISRLNTLSSLLSYFFSYMVEKIIEENFADTCYLVYSGGDDLFVIGAWDKLPDLALKINEDFRKFTSGKLTISSGLCLPPSKKFPLYKAAEEAGEMEEKSKSKGKNRITFMDETLNWNEFGEARKITDEILEIMEMAGGTREVRSLLQILRAGLEEKEFREKGEIPYERIWRLVYSLKRFSERYLSTKKKDFPWELRQKFICDYSLKPHLNVALRWAEFLSRKEK